MRKISPKANKFTEMAKAIQIIAQKVEELEKDVKIIAKYTHIHPDANMIGKVPDAKS